MGGNKACCIRGGAPSPDGIAPRPVVIAAGSEAPEPQLHEADKHQPVGPAVPVLSWPSRFSKAEDEGELHAIFDQPIGGDPSDVEVESSIIPNRFSAVRNKLKKHLSRDSIVRVSNSRTRSSVGTSEEEVARRAELKHIRKKRILDELGNSKAYDEDAKSVGTSAFDTYSKRVISNPSTQNASVVTSAVVSAAATPATLSRRHSCSTTEKPPLALENAFDYGRRRRSSVPDTPAPPVLKPIILPTVDDPGSRRSSWRLSFSAEGRRASCLRALSQDHGSRQEQSRSRSTAEQEIIHTGKNTVDAHEAIAPSSPVTPLTYMKWTKSQNLGLTPAATSHDHVHVAGAHPHDDHDAAQTRTRASITFGGVDGHQEQSLRRDDIWARIEADPMGPEACRMLGEDVNSRHQISNLNDKPLIDIGKTDHKDADANCSRPDSGVIPLHKLRISHLLASRGPTSNPSSRQSSRAESSHTLDTTTEESFLLINNRRSRFFRKTSSSGLTEGKIPPSWGQVLQQDGTSSVYLSDAAATTIKSASGHRAIDSMPAISVPEYPSRYSHVTTTNLVIDHPRSRPRNVPQDRIDVVSIPPVVLTSPDEATQVPLTRTRKPPPRSSKRYMGRSESDINIAGFLGMKGLFPSRRASKEVTHAQPRHHILAQRKTSSTVTSVLVEQLDQVQPVRKSSSRSSFLSAIGLPRLGKGATRSYDGSSSVDYSNSVPKRKPSNLKLYNLPKPGETELSPRRASSQREAGTPSLWKTTEMETSEQMWHRAIRQSIDAKALEIQREFAIQPSPTTRPSMALPKLVKELRNSNLANIADDSESDADETTLLSRTAIDHSAFEVQDGHTPKFKLDVPKITFQKAESVAMTFGQTALTEQLAIQGMGGGTGRQLLDTQGPGHGALTPISIHAPDSGKSSRTPAEVFQRASQISKSSFTRKVTPPQSWAKFPSHTRDERCGSTGPADAVETQDFATVVLEDGTEVFVTGQRKHLHHHREGHSHGHHNHSLPERVTMKIRTSLDRLRTKQATMTNDAVLGRRSSTSAGGHLEAPELELLPMLGVRGDQEVKEVERDAAEEGRIRERMTRMTLLQSDGGSEHIIDVAEGHTELLKSGKVGIGESKFYSDCLDSDISRAFSIRSHTTINPEEFGSWDESLLSGEEKVLSQKGKYGTWSGRERGKMADRLLERELRKSTVDFEKQARLMEERERLLVLRKVESLLAGVGAGGIAAEKSRQIVGVEQV